MARHVLLVKSHVSAFTRKDGTFVAAHDDKRTASSASPAPQPRTARPKNPAARSYSGSGAGGMDHDSPAPAPAADNAQPRVARPANKSARAYSGSGSTPDTPPANPAQDSPSTSSAYVSRFSTLESAKRYQSNNAKPTKVFHHPEGGFFVPPHARSSSTYEKAGHKVALHYNGKPPAPDDVKKPSSTLVKSHVSAFTRKDGVFVAAHDDKRTKAAITAAQGGDKPVKRVVDSIKQQNKNAAAGLKDTIASDFSKGDISTGDGADMTYGKFNDHLASMRTQLGNDPAHSEHLKHAQFALHQTSGGGGGSSAPIKEKHAKLYGAALSGKTKIDDDGMVRHAAK
ncbi:hypothetical protein [Polynucleobacter sp.]|uniref:hypothetical protein n=1 Tax=Polynucleobacter sp. TaxID=2029855 RepID=UPI003F69CFC2